MVNDEANFFSMMPGKNTRMPEIFSLNPGREITNCCLYSAVAFFYDVQVMQFMARNMIAKSTDRGPVIISYSASE